MSLIHTYRTCRSIAPVLFRRFRFFFHQCRDVTADGGRIIVRGRASDDGTASRFAVSDAGPWISPDHLPHVFDRFWQAEKTANLGTRLGLGIARGIAEAHRGHVSVESEKNRGATFVLSIPVLKECSSAVR